MWRETAAILLASSASPEFRARLASLAGIPKRSDTMSLAISNALDDLEWTKATEQFTKSARIFERQIVAAGKIKENLPKKFVASMAFDAVDPRATLWADQHAAILVREITDETRSAIQKVILDALNGDYTIDDAGELVSRVIGLTERQAKAVENSYNATIDNLVKDGVSRRTAIARAKELSKAYRERLILKRGEMIARTEIMRAANNGRLLSWAQAMDAGLIEATMQKEWRTFPGYGATGPCPICLELRGVTVPVLSEFPNGALMPPGHPFCRCTAILVPPTRGLPRVAQVGGGYVGVKRDPLGEQLASDIRSNEVAKFNLHHDRLGRFSHASGAHMDTGNATSTSVSGHFRQESDRLTKKYGKISAWGAAEGSSIPNDTSPKNVGATKAVLRDWTHKMEAFDRAGYGETGAQPIRSFNMQHLGIVQNHRDAFDENHRQYFVGAVFRLSSYSHVERLERHAIRLHEAVRKGRPEQPELWRGIEDDFDGIAKSLPKIPVGTTFTLPLSSFSRDPRIADSYAGGGRSGSVRAIIRVRPGAKGVAVREHYAHDQEVITAGNFRILAHESVKSETGATTHFIDVEQVDVPSIDPSLVNREARNVLKAAKFSKEQCLALALALPAFSDLRLRGNVVKFNPHHDKRGRFARKPGAANPTASIPLPQTDYESWKSAPANTRYGAREVLKDPRGFVQSTRSKRKGQNGHFDVYLDEKEIWGESAVPPAIRMQLGYNALLSAHKTTERHPELYRGLPEPLHGGESLKAGDTFDLVPSGFSSRKQTAIDFYSVDYGREQVATRPTLIRMKAGSRGLRIPNRKSGAADEHEDEVIVQGKFRVLGISTRQEETATLTIIDVEHVGTYDPNTGALWENGKAS